MPDRQAASFVCAHAASYGMLRRGLQDGWPDVTGVSDAAGLPTPGHSAPGPFREDNCNIAILRFAASIGSSSQKSLDADRKRVVEGKRLSVRVDLGGGPLNKKKKLEKN